MIETRMEAYTGWLVSNQYFHAEVAELRGLWEALVRERGRFPFYRLWPGAHDQEMADVPDQFRAACDQFYHRWELDGMLTWDWPVPMEPDLALGMRQDLHLVGKAGALFFVPWYMLRGEKLNLQAVAQRARTACEEEHLRDWLDKRSGRPRDEMGDIRYERLAWLYRYHELALRRRHGTSCRGNVQRLDRALAKVLKRDENTVKKLRLELQRGLPDSGRSTRPRVRPRSPR